MTMRLKISRLRLEEIIREVYRDHQACGLPRPTPGELDAAAGLPPGCTWRLVHLARAMRETGELPDLPRGDRFAPRTGVDPTAVAAALAITRIRTPRRSAVADPPPPRPADPRADLLREHLERERRIRRWAQAHGEVPCRCD